MDVKKIFHGIAAFIRNNTIYKLIQTELAQMIRKSKRGPRGQYLTKAKKIANASVNVNEEKWDGIVNRVVGVHVRENDVVASGASIDESILVIKNTETLVDVLQFVTEVKHELIDMISLETKLLQELARDILLFEVSQPNIVALALQIRSLDVR